MADDENTHEAPEVPDGPEAPDPETATTTAEPQAAPPAPAATPVAAGPRLRDRLFSFRSVVAVSLATLLLGGAGGAALVAATGDDHNDVRRVGRFGPGPGGFDNGFGPRFRHNGGPGQQFSQQYPPGYQGGQGSQEEPPGPPGGSS